MKGKKKISDLKNLLFRFPSQLIRDFKRYAIYQNNTSEFFELWGLSCHLNGHKEILIKCEAKKKYFSILLRGCKWRLFYSFYF